MKPAIYLAVSLLCLAAVPGTLAVGEDVILSFLEELRGRMCHPIDKWNLPALDPFEIAYAEVEADTPVLVNFNASVTNFKLTGLSDFVINDLQLNTLGNKASIINVTLPMTAFKSLYTAYGSLAYILNLAGRGDAEAFVEKLTVAISWSFPTLGNSGIRNLKIDISIGKIFVYFENLFEEPRIDDFMHALINELGLELLHDIWEVEQPVVEQLVEDKINSFLGQYRMAQLLEIIGGSDKAVTYAIGFGPEDPPADCKTGTQRLHPLLRLKEQLRRR